MDRRQFISICAAAGGSLVLPGANAVPIPMGDVCRTRPVGGFLNAAQVSNDGLVIAGTRLFKEGFLDDALPQYAKLSGRVARMLGGGCDDGVAGVRLGSAQLGGVCCPIESAPSRMLQGYLVAKDMKVIVAHPSVAANDVSLAQLKAILGGQVTRWKELGGEDSAISLVVHDHCPDYVEPVRQSLLGNQAIWSRQAMVVKTDQKQLETVARFPGAVGVNSWILAEPFVKAGQLKVLAINGVAPTLNNAAKGAYPLVGPLLLVFKQWNDGLGPFFSFLYSDAGQKIVSRRAISVTPEQAGYRPRGAIKA